MSTPSAVPVTIIEARPDTTAGTLRAMWRYRGFYRFLFKEILLRKARGTLLGFWWLILRPLIAAIGYIVAFSVVAPIATGHEVPYPIFFLSGFIPWRFFEGTLTTLPRSLMWTRGIMQRTYFPRLLVPLAGFGPVLVELAILVTLFLGYVGFAWWGGEMPLRLGAHTWWLLPCLLAALMMALAFGMVLSIVALFFRDIVFTIGYIAQLFMFATPVLYPISFVPEQYRWVVYTLNPMAEVVTMSRLALTGRGEYEPWLLAQSFATILVLFILGVTFFLRAERHLGDQL
jgi:lipopolysaccharide transport system permease protein